MTAEELRASMGLNAKEIEVQKYVERIENELLKVSSQGGRQYTAKGYPVALGSEIAVHFVKSGFHVNHYVAPWEEILIRW